MLAVSLFKEKLCGIKTVIFLREHEEKRVGGIPSFYTYSSHLAWGDEEPPILAWKHLGDIFK